MVNALQDKAGSGVPAPQTSGLTFSEITDTGAVEDIVFLARRAHEESRFSHITFAPKKVRAIVERVIADPKRHAVMVARNRGRPAGFAYCSIGEYYIGTGTLVTTIHTINVLREVRHGLRGGRAALGLLRGIETWSKARSSKEILFHVTSDIDLKRTHKFIKRLGYRFIGGSYAKNLI